MHINKMSGFNVITNFLPHVIEINVQGVDMILIFKAEIQKINKIDF